MPIKVIIMNNIIRGSCLTKRDQYTRVGDSAKYVVITSSDLFVKYFLKIIGIKRIIVPISAINILGLASFTPKK